MEDFHCHYTPEERQKHERQFYSDRPKDCIESINHPSGVKKGDMVVIYNSYDILVGPYKVLGFTTLWGEMPRMYLDWDCWWFPALVSKIYKIM